MDFSTVSADPTPPNPTQLYHSKLEYEAHIENRTSSIYNRPSHSLSYPIPLLIHPILFSAIQRMSQPCLPNSNPTRITHPIRSVYSEIRNHTSSIHYRPSLLSYPTRPSPTTPSPPLPPPRRHSPNPLTTSIQHIHPRTPRPSISKANSLTSRTFPNNGFTYIKLEIIRLVYPGGSRGGGGGGSHLFFSYESMNRWALLPPLPSLLIY